jgi:hypothetical protein
VPSSEILLGAKINENKLVGSCSTHIGHNKLEQDVNLNMERNKEDINRTRVII